ncbi:M13 family metallopeptidase [Corynebacterium choanae]|nr:M13-type metalloendopeptidase [Corynebacterium choanae]
MKDLYTFMNGTYLDEHVIPDDRGIDGMFVQLRDKSEEDIHTLLKTNEGPAGVLYRSFMDVAAINAAGTTPIHGLLDEVVAVSEASQLPGLFGKRDREGYGAPLGVFTAKAPDDEMEVPYLVQSGLSLPDEAYYREEAHAEIRAKFQQHLVRMLGFLPEQYLLGKSVEEAAQIIFDLETAIASHHWDVVTSRDALKTTNPMDSSELPLSAQTILEAMRVPQGRVINCMPSYFIELDGLLSKEDLLAWKLYLIWHTLSGSAAMLTEEIARANFDFYGRELVGSTEQRERWKRAVSLAESKAGEDLGKAYVAEHFPPSHKAEMEELVRYLLAAYKERIEKLEWMTPTTREKALEKLSKFRAKIGYADKWRDFSGLQLTEGGAQLVENVRLASVFNHDYEIAKLGKPTDRDEWLCTPQTVNAFYNPSVNDITFPAAILQWPFYDPTSDAAENFGGIGAVIGHEIGHGFDDQGSQYDGIGNLESWWTDEDRAAFEALTSKLVGQFEGLVPRALREAGIESSGVNGKFTLGENIGDLGGLGIAVVAYRNWLKDQGLTFATAPSSTTKAEGASPEVEGREFTGLQRLFMAYARVWRSKVRPEYAAQALAIDPHSPAEFRCNVIAANVDEFYEAFDVEEGSIVWLDPQDRVTIW